MALGRFSEWLGFKKSVQGTPGVSTKFFLKYHDLLVGTLSVHDGIWTFEYSEDFRQSDILRPIVEFPDINKTYRSKELWQFFTSRIPSSEQAEVEEILRQEHIEEDDAVSLLKRFGRRTVANPFHLEVGT